MILLLIIALALPAVVNLARPVRLTPIWTIPSWTLLPVVLLASPLVAVSRDAAVRILAVALALPIAAVLAAPVVALTIFHLGRADVHSRYRLTAEAITDTWRSATTQPLRLVGSGAPPNGVAFYLADAAPLAVSDPRVAPWIARERVTTQGIALVCPVESKSCIDEIDRIDQAHTAVRREVTLARSYLGIRGRTVRYLIAAVPPAR
jgi:hypothetical protein